MSVDRDLWKSRLYKHCVPNWPCPSCGAAALEIVDNSLYSMRDSATYRAIDHPEFEPDWDCGRFTCLLRCAKPKCKESCSVAGIYSTDIDDSGYGYTQIFEPTCIQPPPPMISIPSRCPTVIREEVVRAFVLYWMDRSASLNRIRNALELLLSNLGIPRYSDKNGRRTRHSLHARIECLKKRKPLLSEICDRMMAVKHLGNAGSHPGDTVSADDVFDGLNILERVLHDVYSDETTLLAKIVKKINYKRGPRKHDH